MSALSGLHIDNLTIYIDASEVPIMDGSSKPFVDLIEKVGIEVQNKKRNNFNIYRPVSNTHLRDHETREHRVCADLV